MPALNAQLRQISGPWDDGWVLDKHSISSVYLGDDENGRRRFDTKRTEVGEASYQLKYKQDWKQAMPLAQAIVDNIYPKFGNVGFIVPMPASNPRPRQPVTEVANALGSIVQRPVFDNLLLKAANGHSLKDLGTKAEKVKAIGDSFSINDVLEGNGPWNVLVVDDLFHTGASMEAACKALRSYPKVRRVYVAALTWKSV